VTSQPSQTAGARPIDKSIDTRRRCIGPGLRPRSPPSRSTATSRPRSGSCWARATSGKTTMATGMARALASLPIGRIHRRRPGVAVGRGVTPGSHPYSQRRRLAVTGVTRAGVSCCHTGVPRPAVIDVALPCEFPPGACGTCGDGEARVPTSGSAPRLSPLLPRRDHGAVAPAWPRGPPGVTIPLLSHVRRRNSSSGRWTIRSDRSSI
jgi:hypothetical protein